MWKLFRQIVVYLSYSIFPIYRRQIKIPKQIPSLVHTSRNNGYQKKGFIYMKFSPLPSLTVNLIWNAWLRLLGSMK